MMVIVNLTTVEEIIMSKDFRTLSYFTRKWDPPVSKRRCAGIVILLCLPMLSLAQEQEKKPVDLNGLWNDDFDRITHTGEKVEAVLVKMPGGDRGFREGDWDISGSFDGKKFSGQVHVKLSLEDQPSCPSQADGSAPIELTLSDDENSLTGQWLKYWIDLDSCEITSSEWQPTTYTRQRDKLTLLDPACSTINSCEGEFLQAAGDTVTITADPNALLKSNVEQLGVVTDGVTQLLLRLKSEDAVTFTLQDASLGCLLDVMSPGTCSSTVTIQPVATAEGDKYVFAAYRAPNNYPAESPNTSVKVTVEAKGNGGVIDSKEIELHAPPVVLVHGLWDKPDSWAPVKSALESNGYKVTLVGHNRGTYPAAGSFDPSDTTGTNVAVPELVKKIKVALNAERQAGFAVTQVDVVGHSMGGLISRAAVRYQGEGYQYQRKVNYNKGDFHKLITLGTPHGGSRLADVLVNGKCRKRPYNCWAEAGADSVTEGAVAGGVTLLTCKPQTLDETLANVNIPFIVDKHPLGPGVYDLQTGSTALQHLGVTPVPVHAMVGIASSDSLLEKGLNFLLKSYGLKAIGDKEGVDEDDRTIDQLLGGDLQHDAIVSIPSQQGSLTGSNVTSIADAHHLEEIKQAGDTILTLLRTAPDSASFATGFPAPALENKSNLAFTPGCPESTTKKSERQFTSNATVTFEPPQGTLVTAGQKVTFRFDVQGGSPQTSALFAVGEQLAVIDGSPPYTFEYTVPANPDGGKINVFVQTTTEDENEEVYSVQSFLITGVLPDLGVGTATDAQGQTINTTARFAGGISINSGTFQTNIAQLLADLVKVEGLITVEPSHVGQPADLFVYGAYRPTYPDTPDYYMLSLPDATGIEPWAQEATVRKWDRNPATLIGLEKGVTLLPNQPLSVYEGEFIATGFLDIYFGYRLQDGTMVVNTTPIHTIINP